MKILPCIPSTVSLSSKPDNYSFSNANPINYRDRIKTSYAADIVSFGAIKGKANIKILDCTLRDGGFVNNWKFGSNNILGIFRQLEQSKIDIIEVGYLYKAAAPSVDQTRFASTEAINNTFKDIKNKKSLVSAMIDYGDCDSKSIELRKDGFVDIIRLAFKKNNADNAIEFAKELKNKGYDVFVQPTSVTSYSRQELIDLINKINKLKPKGMGIVDTYGLLDKEELRKYYNLLDKNLNKDIGIDFHAHNNLQLGLSNALELAGKKTKRKIYLDSSLYGMGKSAGNVNTESLSMELNRKCGKKYNIDSIIEAISNFIMPIYGRTNKWGYSLSYFMSALNRCHPNYTNYLISKKMPIVQVNAILKSIELSKKLQFDQKYIEDLCKNYSE